MALAAIHAQLIKHSASIELCAEMELLFQLQMLPEQITNSSRLQAEGLFRLQTGRQATQYSLTVLSQTGRWLIRSRFTFC